MTEESQPSVNLDKTVTNSSSPQKQAKGKRIIKWSLGCLGLIFLGFIGLGILGYMVTPPEERAKWKKEQEDARSQERIKNSKSRLADQPKQIKQKDTKRNDNGYIQKTSNSYDTSYGQNISSVYFGKDKNKCWDLTLLSKDVKQGFKLNTARTKYLCSSPMSCFSDMYYQEVKVKNQGGYSNIEITKLDPEKKIILIKYDCKVVAYKNGKYYPMKKSGTLTISGKFYDDFTGSSEKVSPYKAAKDLANMTFYQVLGTQEKKVEKQDKINVIIALALPSLAFTPRKNIDEELRKIMKYFKQAAQNPVLSKKVNAFSISFTTKLKDKYGNMKDSVIMFLTIKMDTLKKINFDNINLIEFLRIMKEDGRLEATRGVLPK